MRAANQRPILALGTARLAVGPRRLHRRRSAHGRQLTRVRRVKRRRPTVTPGEREFPVDQGPAARKGEPAAALRIPSSRPRTRGCRASSVSYQTSLRAYMQRALQRGSKYLPRMARILVEEGVPRRARLPADRRERLQRARRLARRRRRPLAVRARHRPALRPAHRRLRRRAARPGEGHPRRGPLPARPLRALRRLAPGPGRLQHRRGQHRAHPELEGLRGLLGDERPRLPAERDLGVRAAFPRRGRGGEVARGVRLRRDADVADRASKPSRSPVRSRSRRWPSSAAATRRRSASSTRPSTAASCRRRATRSACRRAPASSSRSRSPPTASPYADAARRARARTHTVRRGETLDGHRQAATA